MEPTEQTKTNVILAFIAAHPILTLSLVAMVSCFILQLAGVVDLVALVKAFRS